MSFRNNFGEYHLIRSLSIITIIILIIISVYQLNLTLEFLKKLIDHIEDTHAAFERHNAKNSTLAKLMFQPMEQNAHDLYHKHESSILTNIIVFTSLIATSMAGLIVAYRKNTIALIVYAIALDLIYLSSFLYCSRIPAFHCAYIVFVSIIIYIRAYHLHSKRSQTKIRLIQTSNSDAEIIKNAL